MKFLFLLVAILAGLGSGLAQDVPKDKKAFVLPAGEYWYKQSWADSTYLYDQFQPGDIELATGVTPTNRPLLNYNVFLETMFVRQGDELVALEPKSIKTVLIGKHKLIYAPGFGYMEVIVEGKISVAERTMMHSNFVATYTVPRNSGIWADSRTAVSKSKRYFWTEMDYFMFEDRSHIHHAGIVPLYKKFASKKNEIKRFVKEHKTDFQKKEDVLEVASYCNRKL